LEIFFHEGPEIQATVLAGQRIPVPLSKDRVRQRQFNQAQLLAKKI
jgi:predicted amidophosphoribosyltransferase